MKPCRFAMAAAGMVLTVAVTAQAQTDLFRCRQADGSITFSDHGGPGCRKGEFKADVQVLEREAVPSEGPPAAPAPDNPAPAPGAPQRPARALSSQSFPAATRSIPALGFHDLSPDLKAKGMSIPNKGDINIDHIAVSHLAAGNGPKFSADAHFQGTGRDALGTAAMAAAKAVQYDPRYLQVALTMPIGFAILERQVRVDGPSAGVALAVAIASAILGDPLRPDVCLSGTMDLNLKVGPVGGLESKIDGCHMLPGFREMLLPAGQNNFTIKGKGLSYSIKVTEVATLAEAYEIATGRELRPFQQR